MKKRRQIKRSRFFSRDCGKLACKALLVLCLVAGVIPAAAQPQATITLDLRGATLLDALKEINRQTGDNSVSYKTQEVEKESRRITLRLQNVTVHRAVEEALKGTGLQAVVRGSEVLVVPKAATPAAQLSAYAISGTVRDPEGNPLIGATVIIKGTTIGAATDQAGRFELSIPRAGRTTLLVSFIGFVSQEIVVEHSGVYNIEMEPDVAEMAEIVITGFPRREKSQSTGAISVATERDLEMAGITTVDKALAGKLSGVYIRSASGRPGETGKIQIRGINTMTGSTEPLYILDGMPLQTGEVSGGINELLTNGLGNIPPENIQSITILKDATAASIYGARAANGVVVIETKMGKAGQDYISYSGKFGVTMAPRNQFDFMNSREKIDFEMELYDQFHPDHGGRGVQILNQRDNGTITPQQAERQLDALRNINTNWMDELYSNALSHSHNITLSGGNTRMQYFASANYQNAQGTLMENKFQSGGLNLKLNRYITDNLLVKVNLYSTIKQNKEGQSGMDPFKYASFANPYEKPYNDDGSYAADMTYNNLKNNILYLQGMSYQDFNMIRELRENTLTNHYADIRGQFGVEWRFLKDFRYDLNMVVNYTWVQNIDESRPGTYRSWINNWLNDASMYGNVLPQFNQGFLDESSGRTFDYTVRNTLEYNKNIAGKHFVQVFFANEVGGKTNNGFNHFNPVYLFDYRMAGYPSWSSISQDRELIEKLKLEKFGKTFLKEERSVSFIGSLVYSYDDRYVLNANARYDGVDIVGTDNQFAPLWSAGLKWNAHNEQFLKPYSDIVSRLALSVGYGYRGSINRSVYPFHRYLVGTTIYDGMATANEFIYGNPSIKWERKQELNLGLEMSFLKGRLNLEGRYFDEKIKDLLEQQKLAPSVGRPDATVNVGRMSNRGFEVSLRVEAIKNQNFLWEIGGNITKVKNNLVNVFSKEPPVVGTSYTYNVEGHPTNSWFGYKFSHVDPATGNMIVGAQRKQEHVDAAGNVSYQYSDATIDLSTLSTAELQSDYAPYYLGHKDPDIYGGFNTRLVYKQWELYSNFVFASGNRILNFQDRLNGPDASGSPVDDITASRTNRIRNMRYRWQQYGDITDIPGFKTTRTNYSSYLIDRDLDKGKYLKCTELALTWRAGRKLLNRTSLSTLKVTLVASNLFTLTPYRGIDPELQMPFGYPTTPSYTITLNVVF